jgi:cytochrome oxidase Cu insertion factor (SCO1/SenC/PrrC family)
VRCSAYPTIRSTTVADTIAGAYPAPPFPTNLDWINTGGKALTLEDLRGRLVLLDFWTYG